jgi:hypothetical protein
MGQDCRGSAVGAGCCHDLFSFPTRIGLADDNCAGRAGPVDATSVAVTFSVAPLAGEVGALVAVEVVEGLSSTT